MSDTTNARIGSRFGAGEITMLGRLCDELAGASRSMRQKAAHELAERVKIDPASVAAESDKVIPALIDALFRPEAQTRWESLDALSALVDACPDAVLEAYEGAEASLFDEGSSTVHVAAFRLLAKLGAHAPELSDRVWPLLDEAIQCFHGDMGYRDMLATLLEFVRGNISEDTKHALAARVAFDAENGRGYVKVRSAEIIAAVKGE